MFLCFVPASIFLWPCASFVFLQHRNCEYMLHVLECLSMWRWMRYRMCDEIETHMHYSRASRAASRLSRQSPDVTYNTHSHSHKQKETLVRHCLFRAIAVWNVCMRVCNRKESPPTSAAIAVAPNQTKSLRLNAWSKYTFAWALSTPNAKKRTLFSVCTACLNATPTHTHLHFCPGKLSVNRRSREQQ